MNESEHHSKWPLLAAVIGAVAALLASLGGLVFSNLTYRQGTEQARQAQVAQTSERFSRSVEQLGSDSIAVRIGAVYSFDRLMQDSEVDQQAVVDILSAFIDIQADTVRGQSQKKAPVDFLAALKVLNDFWKTGPPDQPSMHLSTVNLSAFVLDSPKMGGADLTGADLTYAHLRYAYLKNADLKNADLSHSDLLDANLSLVKLAGARLEGTDLTGVDLTGVDLTGADLTGADLTGADLTGAVLTGEDLTGVKCSPTTKWPAAFPSPPQCGQ
jgi:uncharacterized protein YjbI with pentapeptide repeats